jgi:hypothetical protein
VSRTRRRAGRVRPETPLPEGPRPVLPLALACVALLTVANLLSDQLGLKYVQEVEWPTDLATLDALDRQAPDVAIVGSSRSHYGLPPSALDLCLGDALGHPTETLAGNRLAASLYAADAVARDLFDGPRAPRVLVVEVAPESLNANHFQLDYNVASSADVADIPACLADGRPSWSACARPLVRGVENLAFYLHRPWTDREHVEWMALFHGGGQYCYDNEACLARNNTYDRGHSERWDTRVKRVLPHVRSERFANYEVGTGLPSARFVALLRRARAAGSTVVVVNMPVSETYAAEMPAEAVAAFSAWVTATTAAEGARYFDYDTEEWRGARERFLDPDHLNATGARMLTDRLCAGVVDALH